MKQKVIVIDGTDGCGKATQTKKLYDALREQGHSVRYLEFPRYGNLAAEPVKRYLNGQYGKEADSVSPYAASSLYAIDRFDCFNSEPIDEEIILADRYTTSNIIHQASKIEDKEEREAYINWLEDFEYDKLSIPRPDLVLFLDLPPEVSEQLIENRSITTSREKDIHENDDEYLEKSYKTAKELADSLGWETVECTNENGLRTVEDIHHEIKKIVDDLIKTSLENKDV